MNPNEIKVVDKVIIAQNNYGSKIETFYNSYETCKIINPPTSEISGIYYESVLCNHCKKEFDLSIEYRLMALLTPDIIATMLNDKLGRRIINKLIFNSLDLYANFGMLSGLLVFFILLFIFTTSNPFTFSLSNDKIIYLVIITILLFGIIINWIKYQKNKRCVNQGYALININDQIKLDYFKNFRIEKKSIVTTAYLGKREQSKFIRTEPSNVIQGIGSHEHVLENTQQVADNNESKEKICLKNNPWLT